MTDERWRVNLGVSLALVDSVEGPEFPALVNGNADMGAFVGVGYVRITDPACGVPVGLYQITR